MAVSGDFLLNVICQCMRRIVPNKQQSWPPKEEDGVGGETLRKIQKTEGNVNGV